MYLKHSVRFGNSELAMACALTIVNDVFNKYDYECVITSANDLSHGTGSLHYTDRALDFRSKHIKTSAEKQNILTEIQVRLTKDFDVTFENIGTVNEHFHLEYDKE